VPIAGDAKLIIAEIVKEIDKLGGSEAQPNRDQWRQTLSGWQEKYPLVYGDHEPGKLLKPQFVIEKLAEASPDDTIVCSGVGQHQMWASQYWTFNHPYTWINSGGLGTMGYSIPAAVGAQVGQPDRMVWAVDGDGCFQMTSQELITAAVEGIPVKVAILNNSWLGMVRQWQELFYDERFSETHFGNEIPNYKMWAEAMGCVAFRVDSPEEVEPTIQKANEITDRPVVIDFRTQAEENVYPMVPAGASNSARRGGVAMTAASGPEFHTVVVRVENKAGVLARIAGLFSRRGFNIESLAVAPTEDDRFSRITFVVDVASTTIDQVVKQLDKLVNVLEISELDPETSVERELLMATLAAPTAEARSEIIDLVRIFDAQVLNVGFDQLMVSLAGSQRRLNDFEALLGRYGIIELQRTGKIALSELPKVQSTRQSDTPS